MQDALLSDTTISLLSGNAVQTANVQIVGREVLTVSATPFKVTLAQTPDANSVTAYKMAGAIMDTELTGATVSAKDVTFSTGVAQGDKVMVFYTYTLATGASKITFSGNAFPATYKVVGDTIVRGEDGVNRKMQFIIPKAKLKSDFTLTMDSSNVATFDLNLDVLLDTATQNLYDIVRVN
jgi:hypothetical protein